MGIMIDEVTSDLASGFIEENWTAFLDYLEEHGEDEPDVVAEDVVKGLRGQS